MLHLDIAVSGRVLVSLEIGSEFGKRGRLERRMEGRGSGNLNIEGRTGRLNPLMRIVY